MQKLAYILLISRIVRPFLVMVLRRMVWMYVALVASVGTAYATPELKNITIYKSKDVYNITLEFNTMRGFKIHTLDKNASGMYRLVIDSPHFKTKVAEILQVKESNVIKVARYGNFKPHISRFVVEMYTPVIIGSINVDRSPTTFKLTIPIQPTATYTEKTIQTKSWAGIEKNNALAEKIEKRQQDVTYRKVRGNRSVRKKPLIVIDAGHGGHDPGAIGVGGVYEKQVVLVLARMAKVSLEATGKFQVYLTRSTDKYIKLHERYAIAEKVGADFFISIHADAHRKKSVRGMSVYTLNDTSRTLATRKLENTNALESKGIYRQQYGDVHVGNMDVTRILADLDWDDNAQKSEYFAHNILTKTMRANRIVTLGNPARDASLAVLKSPTMPSVLIEAAYMSNKYDIINLQSSIWRKRFVQALTTSMDAYFKKYPLVNE